MLFYSLFILMVFNGLLFMILNRKLVLTMLLSLEFSMLGLLLLLVKSLTMFFMEYYFLMIFMVFMVMGSVMGLLVMILLVRYWGNDIFMFINMLEC
uniref:NADH dehydrogenase subunit 4L n=1 Tax=Lype phaeopa TaxID=623209 RepID=A0A7D7ATU0_9NEOP|nr:NADH dehydrogenase subunit 4L [Lype phaeopa]